MIDMLSVRLERAGVAGINASGERDADVLIMCKAIEFGERNDIVIVIVAEDTDIIVLLVRTSFTWTRNSTLWLSIQRKKHQVLFAGACYSCMR